MPTRKIKRRLLKRVVIFIAIIFAILFFYSCFKLSMEFIEKENYTTKEYTNSGSADYSVYTEENQFYENSKLDSDRAYIIDMTKDLNVTFKYNFDSEVSLPINYSYMIKATLYGLYNQDPISSDNPVLWDKEYIIKDSTGVLTTTGKEISLNETFNIDIRTYINEILNFINAYQITTLSYIKIEMPISVSGSDGLYSVNTNYDISIKINIEDKVFTIDKINVDDNTNYLSVEKNDKSTIDITSVIIYVILLLSSLTISSLTIKKAISYHGIENYEQKLEKLKNDYSDVIIGTNNMVDMKDLKVISIINFDEILNLATNLSSPIMLYEREKVAKFYILVNGIIYIYLLKEKQKKSTY